MKKMLYFFTFLLSGLTSASALNLGSPSYSQAFANNQVEAIIMSAQNVVSMLIPLMIGAAMIAFFWYLIVFISKGEESADKRQLGLKGMGYSIIAIFVMVSIWGIIFFIGTVLGIGQGGGDDFYIQMPRAR